MVRIGVAVQVPDVTLSHGWQIAVVADNFRDHDQGGGQPERMLQLARERAAGAYPLLVTPDYTARSRSLLGDDAALVVGQFVVVDSDPERARALARGPLGFMTAGAGSGYAANLHRMGFAEEEIAQVSDRLVDAVVAWGDPDAVAARIVEHLRAGADQVVLSVLSADPPGSLPVQQWRQLAKALIS